MHAAQPIPRLSPTEARILEAFLDPEATILAVAQSLKLTLQELLDALTGPAIRAAFDTLSHLDAIRRRLALAPIVPGALAALKRLLDQNDKPAEVRRAATTILNTCTRLERAPRAPHATGYAPLQALSSLTPSPRVAGASHQHANATAPAAAPDPARVPRLPAVAGLDRPLPSSTPPTASPASKSQIGRGGPCDESSTPSSHTNGHIAPAPDAPDLVFSPQSSVLPLRRDGPCRESSAPVVTPGPEANVQPETEHRSASPMLAPEGRTTVARGAASRSDASPWIPPHNETFAPEGRANPRVTPAALVAAAGRAISVYDLIPAPARAPPPMARAA